MSARINLDDLDKALNRVNDYQDRVKREARASVHSALFNAYREADEAAMLRSLLLDHARTIAGLQFEVERLTAAALLKPAPARWLTGRCEERESGGWQCELPAGHPNNHHIELEGDTA